MTENKGDLISRSEAEKLGATCLARRNENGQLEAIISLENAPTVKFSLMPADESKEEAYMRGYEKGKIAGILKAYERPQGEWKNVGFMVCECNNCKNQFHELEANNYCPNCGARMRDGADCMDEDAKQASIPYTYNAPQHDWKCGYPDITRDKGGAE